MVTENKNLLFPVKTDFQKESATIEIETAYSIKD